MTDRQKMMADCMIEQWGWQIGRKLQGWRVGVGIGTYCPFPKKEYLTSGGVSQEKVNRTDAGEGGVCEKLVVYDRYELVCKRKKKI